MTTCESKHVGKEEGRDPEWELSSLASQASRTSADWHCKKLTRLASPRAVLSSHPIGENDRTPPDRLLCPSLLIETAVLTILCTQESLRLGRRRPAEFRSNVSSGFCASGYRGDLS